MTELTVWRYRAADPYTYVQALVQLVRHARESTDEFTFGPLRVRECVRDGISLSGPDLHGPMGVLAALPGLVLTDA